MIATLDLLAQPHRTMPYVHMGLSIVLYISSLFSSDSGEFFPITHFICLVLWSSCFLFVMMCSFHVSLLSKCRPRYLTFVPRGPFWILLVSEIVLVIYKNSPKFSVPCKKSPSKCVSVANLMCKDVDIFTKPIRILYARRRNLNSLSYLIL
jgi:hypothetical protein